MAFWFEEGTGDFRSEVLRAADLRGHGSYEAEVHIKYATKAVGLIIIPMGRIGEPFYLQHVESLRRQAEARREEISAT